jgi:outer membrane lipoprotein-sorting protein
MGKEERTSFLKKRSKKLLFLLARADRMSATANKSFLLLFFKKEGLFLLFLSACTPPDRPVLSAADQAEIAHLTDYLNATQKFEAHFIQTGAYGPGAGLVWLDRPGNLRIDYEGSGSRLMVISAGLVRVLDRGTGALTTMPLSKTPLAILLAPTISLSGAVTVTALRHDQGGLQVTLQKTEQPAQGSLTLYLSEAPLQLIAVTVTDSYQRSLTLTLSNMNTAPMLTQDLFKPPMIPPA